MFMVGMRALQGPVGIASGDSNDILFSFLGYEMFGWGLEISGAARNRVCRLSDLQVDVCM